eukprot:COSAG04_NODE_1005_length_8803_cov_3.755642_3_plen_242_part_00
MGGCHRKLIAPVATVVEPEPEPEPTPTPAAAPTPAPAPSEGKARPEPEPEPEPRPPPEPEPAPKPEPQPQPEPEPQPQPEPQPKPKPKPKPKPDAKPAGPPDVDRARFDRFDVDGTGELEMQEIEAMMTEMGFACDKNYLGALLKKVRSDLSCLVEKPASEQACLGTAVRSQRKRMRRLCGVSGDVAIHRSGRNGLPQGPGPGPRSGSCPRTSSNTGSCSCSCSCADRDCVYSIPRGPRAV